MEFKKGDRVFHKGLELIGTFMEYAWNSDEEAIVKFDNADNSDDCRHVSVNQLQKQPSNEEIGERIARYNSGKIYGMF
jgi:hypothetical protein